MAAQLGHVDVVAEFAALAARLHASLDALFWDAQTGAYADFYVADDKAAQTESTAASSSASVSALASTSASDKQQASPNAVASESTTAASAPVSSASAQSAPAKHFVRHAGYVALFPLLLRLVRASDSTRLHALLGTLSGMSQ